MKTLLIGTLLMTSLPTMAQSLDINSLKSLITSKQASLEKVNAGMTKKVVTTSKEGACNYMMTTTSSVLKVESDKIIVFAKEKFQPQNSEACRTAGYTTSTESKVLYYEAKPSVKNELGDLDVFAQDIKAISRAGEVVTLNFSIVDTNESTGATTTENITTKYDLTKPIFKYAVSSQSINFKTTTEDMADIDVKTVDLKNITFCPSAEADDSECMQGDFSDILY